MEDSKECIGCKEVKTFDCFSPIKKGNMGYSSRCKTCLNRAYREKYKLKRDGIVPVNTKARKVMEDYWRFGAWKK